MKPIKTDICNITFVADDCIDLPAYKEGVFIATYWLPSSKEIEDIRLGKPVRVCFAGESLQPMSIDTDD